MTARPYIALGVTQQGRLTPTKLSEQDMAGVAAGRSLPYLLLATGAMTGPHKRAHPITRWRLAAWRFTRALLAFLLAPHVDL